MEPTFLTGIHINRVRHLENIDIPLSADTRKNLLLTGKNGSGKTSVLDKISDELAFNLSQTPRRSLDRSLKGNRIPDVKLPCNDFTGMLQKYIAGTFILDYLGDKRNIHVNISSNIEKVNLKPIYEISDSPSCDLVRYMVNLKATQAFARNESEIGRANEIETWFQRFENILRTVYDDNSLKLNFNIENFQFTISMNGREPFDFNTMSMGYAAVFDIIGDLIMRMESQHRYDLEGIVLIDEIETHLHVELQKKIVPILTELFPNIQFIMTTHSPFVLNSAPNAVVYDLEKHMLVENGLTNLPYEGIVEGYFGADLLSQELREKFEKYRRLVQKSDLTDEDFAEAAELEMYLDEVPDYLALGIATEYSRLKLEFTNRG